MSETKTEEAFCSVCGRAAGELEVFGGVDHFKDFKLIRVFRTMAHTAVLDNPYSKAGEGICASTILTQEEKVKEYDSLEARMVAEHGTEKVECWMFAEQLANTIESSLECKDCVKLSEDDYFKKKFGFSKK